MLTKIGLFFPAGAGEGLLAPREPIHRIMLVLQEVGRFLARQTVCMLSGHNLILSSATAVT